MNTQTDSDSNNNTEVTYKNKEMIVVVDPMCSWCWGFAPVHSQLLDHYKDQFPIKLCMGGLRPGTTVVMPERLRKKVLHHWHQVNEVTGQPFNFNLPADFVYDTEPASRAVITVRTLKPEHVLAYLHDLHKRFYVDNQDITQAQVLAECAEFFGIDQTTFLSHFNSTDMIAATKADFAAAIEFGVTGYPAVAVNYEFGYCPITYGYEPFEEAKKRIDKWLSK